MTENNDGTIYPSNTIEIRTRTLRLRVTTTETKTSYLNTPDTTKRYIQKSTWPKCKRILTLQRYTEDTHKKKNDTKTKDRKTWTPTTEEEEDTQEVAVEEAEASAEDDEDMAEEPEVFPRVKREK